MSSESHSKTSKGKVKRLNHIDRRRFLSNIAGTACGVGLLGLGIGIYSKQASAMNARAIRPPGAIAEEDFLSACTRCGICVRDCPYDILKLAELGDEVPTGTPYFTARTGPCEMCEDIPCVPNCPTGALDHSLLDINKARMGLAVLVDQETCIAFLGLRCEVCFNICPVRGKAITLDYQHNARSGKHARFIPVVHSSDCTGCGLCEKACILEDEPAIKVFPTHLAKGDLGHHYRLGWEQEKKYGGSLIKTPDKHQYNLPKGMHYEQQGAGLVTDKQGNPIIDLTEPASDKSGAQNKPEKTINPLEILNRGNLLKPNGKAK